MAPVIFRNRASMEIPVSSMPRISSEAMARTQVPVMPMSYTRILQRPPPKIPPPWLWIPFRYRVTT